MRRLIPLLAFAGTLVIAAPAAAQLAPPPKLIATKIDHVPLVELYDGGGGLPYLGSTTSYNAGDWENALKAYYHNNVYFQQVAQIDNIADAAIKKGAKAFKAGKGHGHGNQHRKLALVLDIDETSLSN